MNIIILIILSSFVFYSIIISLSNIFWRYSKSKIINKNDLSILIPARNEEENILNCLNSIIRTNKNYKEIIVYNDHSTDGTFEILKKVSKTHSKIKIAKTKKLEKGWIGKSFACYQLAKQSSSEWIIFIDADTEVKDDLSQLINYSLENKLSMLSAWPKIDMKSLSEKIFMPILNFIVYTTCPMIISKKNIDSENLGIAHGACILFNKKTYMKLGGHKLVKKDLFEDTRLARIWRSKGEKNYCIDGKEIISVKMYSTFKEIWNGFKKNYYPSFGRDISFFIFQMIFLISYIISPLIYLWLILTDSNREISLILLILNFIPILIINIKFRYNFFSIFTQPFGISIMLILGISSWKNMKFGNGLTWKDRTYD